MRLIDADKLPRTKIVERRRVMRDGKLRMEHKYVTVIRAQDVDAAETKDANAVKWISVAEWEPYPSDMWMRCSNCKIEYQKTRMPMVSKYCPNCGTRMKLEKPKAIRI